MSWLPISRVLAGIWQNGTVDRLSEHFVWAVIENPVYCGKIALGRRATEKIKGKRNKYHIAKHEHLLSGIAVCPCCGDQMLPNVNRKAKKDGTHYKSIFYYQCRHNRMRDGRVCEFCRSIRQDALNAEVEQLIIEALQSAPFIETARDKLEKQNMKKKSKTG